MNAPTARPTRAARRTTQPATGHGKARQPDRSPATGSDSDSDLDAYVKDVVDTLPPLTEHQRDLLALIFASRRHRKD